MSHDAPIPIDSIGPTPGCTRKVFVLLCNCNPSQTQTQTKPVVSDRTLVRLIHFIDLTSEHNLESSNFNSKQNLDNEEPTTISIQATPQEDRSLCGNFDWR